MILRPRKEDRVVAVVKRSEEIRVQENENLHVCGDLETMRQFAIRAEDHAKDQRWGICV